MFVNGFYFALCVVSEEAVRVPISFQFFSPNATRDSVSALAGPFLRGLRWTFDMFFCPLFPIYILLGGILPVNIKVMAA